MRRLLSTWSALLVMTPALAWACTNAMYDATNPWVGHATDALGGLSLLAITIGGLIFVAFDKKEAPEEGLEDELAMAKRAAGQALISGGFVLGASLFGTHQFVGNGMFFGMAIISISLVLAIAHLRHARVPGTVGYVRLIAATVMIPFGIAIIVLGEHITPVSYKSFPQETEVTF